MTKIKEFIGKIYNWFWEDVLCRTEPFTYQLTRAMVKHGTFFWIVYYIISGFLFYHFFLGALWQQILSIIFLTFLAWLIDHLADEARTNPEKYND